jgi:protocatechuate 3,4-dioxygenase beta subunit
MKRSLLAAIPLFLLIDSAVLAQPAPPRDAAPRPSAPGTAVIRGRVTAASTGQPLHRVRVTLNGALPNPLTTVTDTRGIFEVAEVPAGSYSLTAARGGYLTIQYGQRRPKEAGRTIVVRDAQIVEDVDIALPRASSLSGRIVDELGDPAAGVRVEAMDVRYLRGRRQPVQAAVAITNDIGQFRIGGLEPGAYYLRASTIDTWESDDGKETYAYAQTYYPGMSALDQTRPLSLSLGQHVGDLDFPLAPTRAARITGTLIDGSGEPIADQRVNLDRIERGSGGALFSASFGGNAMSDRDGRFEIRSLPPGEYMLYAGGREIGDARMQVFVAGADVPGVVLTPRQMTVVNGLVATDDARAPDFPAPRMRVVPFAIDEALPVVGTPSALTVSADWTFQFTSVQGRFLFRPAGMPEGWMLKAVHLNDRDVTDTPIGVPAGAGKIAGLRVVIGRTAGRVSGQVVDDRGAPRADSTVIVFSVDSAHWTPGSRFVTAVRPGNDGRFVVGGLPGTVYHVVAREFVVDGEWEDPEFLRDLAAGASKINLPDGGSETITLKLEQQP